MGKLGPVTKLAKTTWTHMCSFHTHVAFILFIYLFPPPLYIVNE